MARRPNIILFVTDQQRWNHVGCNGDGVLKTPHIDALAARGVNFDRFTVASAVCMPNRSTMMTGRMPSLHGVRYNGIPLRSDTVTFVDLLRAAGYATALCGKSHLQNFTPMPAAHAADPAEGAPPPEDLAEARRSTISGIEYEAEKMPDTNRRGYLDLRTPFYGFDSVDLCTLHGDRVRGHYDEWLKKKHGLGADRLRGRDNAIPEPDYVAPQAWHSSIPEEDYPTAYVMDRSQAFLRRHAAEAPDQPFFLQCSFPDPHHPWTPPGRYFRMYDPDAIALPESFANPDPQPTVRHIHDRTAAGEIDRNSIFPFAPTEREAREIIALTYGMISMIDDCVGGVMQTLRELGMEEDTVVIFTSDHGDFMGDHGLMLKGPLHYQGVIRVPFIWADPEIPGGRRCGALAGTLDMARTILSRAGLAPYNGIQGVDLMPLIREETDCVRRGVLIEQDAQRPNFHFKDPIKARSYLTDRWRMSLYKGSAFAELYDLETDPHEMRNLWDDPAHAGIRAEVMQQMLMAMIEHQETSPLPTDFA